MPELPVLLGVLAGAASVVNTLPYIGDIVRGTTRPHRGTWFVWALLAVVVCASQYADGASWSLLMGIAQAALTTVVFVLALRHGEGGLSGAEAIAMAAAGGAVLGWLIAGEPLVATACVILADLLAAALMVPRPTATRAPRRWPPSRAPAWPAPSAPAPSARSTSRCSATRCTSASSTPPSRS